MYARNMMFNSENMIGGGHMVDRSNIFGGRNMIDGYNLTNGKNIMGDNMISDSIMDGYIIGGIGMGCIQYTV